MITIDRGYNNIKKELEYASKHYIKVGLPEDSHVGESKRRGSGRKSTSNMLDMVKIAAINEFGGKKIPERSFIRATIDINRRQIIDFQEKMYDKVLKGEYTASKALGLLGEYVVSKTRNRIRTMTPPNALSTVRRKKSSKPLIDTGQLIQSIQWVERSDV